MLINAKNLQFYELKCFCCDILRVNTLFVVMFQVLTVLDVTKRSGGDISQSGC